MSTYPNHPSPKPPQYPVAGNPYPGGPAGYRPPPTGGGGGGGGGNGCMLAAIIVAVVVGVPVLLMCAGVGYFVYFVKSAIEEGQARQEERQARAQEEMAKAFPEETPVTNVDEALAALDSDNWQMPQKGVQWLIANRVEPGKRAVVAEKLQQRLDGHDSAFSNQCLKALLTWGGKENAPAVANSLKKFGLDQRIACEALGLWKDPATADELAELLNEGGRDGEAAERALEQIGPEASAVVITQLQLSRRTANARAERLLTAYGVDVTDAIVTARLAEIKSADTFQRRDAIKSLASQPFKPQRQAEVARALDAVVAENEHFGRDEALNGLLVWGDKQSAAAVARYVQSETFVNKTAVQLLAKFKEPDTITTLAGLIDNVFADDGVLKEALVAFGPEGEKAVLPSFHDSRHKAKERARAVLAQLETKPDVLLTQTLRDLTSDDDQRLRSALDWLATADIEEARHTEVANRLTGPVNNFALERQALEVLVKCNSPVAATTLAEMIRDRGKQVRVSAAFHKAGTASEGLLLLLLENSDANVAGYACSGLSQYGSEKSIKPLQAVARKSGASNKQLAAVARMAAETVQKRMGVSGG